MDATRSISKFLIVVLVILLAGIAWVSSLPFLLKTQHPIEMIHGISMEPTYSDGDLVILGGISTQNIRVGDVIGHQRTGFLIIRRVITITTGNDGTIISFTVQGDNPATNPFPATPVPPSDIVGKVLFQVPAWLGRVIYPIVSALAQQSLLSLVLALALVAIILVLWRW